MFLCLAQFLIATLLINAQVDSSFLLKLKALDTADMVKDDTASVPQDQLTQKIKLLRSERSGLTTETIIKIKLAEEQQKDKKHDKAFYERLEKELTSGHTGQLLENCLVNLYRRTFTEEEIEELFRFYKTPAGKKMDKEFLLLMVQSVKDAEQLLKQAAAKVEKQ
jgi:hypothetical protein